MCVCVCECVFVCVCVYVYVCVHILKKVYLGSIFSLKQVWLNKIGSVLFWRVFSFIFQES